MLSKTMEEALNKHMNDEFYSAYLYLSMSAYFNSVDLPGLAHWMKVQFDEEMIHAMKFFDFIDKTGGTIRLEKIDAPPKEWKSPLEVFEDTYAHEQLVSQKVHNLVTMAIKENDHATNIFLQWFVAEQVEEEATAQTIMKRMKLIDNQAGGLLMVDQELGKRKELISVSD